MAFLFRGVLVALALPFATSAALGSGKSATPSPQGSVITRATANDLKMDAALRLAVERFETRALAAKLRDGAAGRVAGVLHPALPYGLHERAGGSAPEASVFLRLDRPEAAGELTAQGAKILVQRGDLVLARMPVSLVAPLAASPSVQSMSLSKRWPSLLDSSRTRTRVKDVHQAASPLPQSYQGTGVIVGVLDSGIDYTHDDFRTSATNSRLEALLDFSQGTDGAECRPGQLDSLTCPEIDGSGGSGHGTHVTGIAAGNGRRNALYVGMAPQADLLFVKGIRDAQSSGGFTDADVVNGCAWMLDKAHDLGKPIAINLSLGSQFGAHDGTSLQEQFLDRFAGPGRILVTAAGNSGGDAIHASYPVEGSDYPTALETGLALGTPTGVIDLWAPAGNNFSVGIVAYDPNDITTPLFVTTAAAPGQLVQQAASFTGIPLGDITIDARTTADPNNGARNVLIQIEPSAGGIDPSTIFWSVYTFGSGTFDMWLVTNGSFFPPGFAAPSYFRAGNDENTIGIPATGRRMICVGSHVSKTGWVDIDNVPRVQPGATLDAISAFSSRGPSRDGRVLPNVTAPGEAILSALSANFPAARADILQGGGYQKQQGTSQAAPHVTGIAALMLQRNPALTPENVRSILQQTATAAGAGNPNNSFGRGRVHAHAALQATPDPLQCTVILANGLMVACDEVASQPLSLLAYPNPAPGRVRFAFTAPSRERVYLALYDAMGRRVRTLLKEEVAPGAYSPTWNGDDDSGRLLPSGMYFARLMTPSASRSIRLMLTR